jgi:hypothetical protein
MITHFFRTFVSYILHSETKPINLIQCIYTVRQHIFWIFLSCSITSEGCPPISIHRLESCVLSERQHFCWDLTTLHCHRLGPNPHAPPLHFSHSLKYIFYLLGIQWKGCLRTYYRLQIPFRIEEVWKQTL